MKQKNILIVLIICTLIVCLFFVVFIIKTYSPKKEISSEITTYPVTGYLLGEYEGKLATYSTNSDVPIEVFDVYVSSLPVEDIEEIEEGIYANNEEALQSLIEDFTS